MIVVAFGSLYRRNISPPSEFLQTLLCRKILRGHVRTVTGNMQVKFESAALTILELLALNAPKFEGHVTLATPPFRKIFKGSCSD